MYTQMTFKWGHTENRYPMLINKRILKLCCGIIVFEVVASDVHLQCSPVLTSFPAHFVFEELNKC